MSNLTALSHNGYRICVYRAFRDYDARTYCWTGFVEEERRGGYRIDLPCFDTEAEALEAARTEASW